MRSVHEIRNAWNAFFSDPMLSMDSVRQRGINGDITADDLRSLYWKIYLDYLPSLNPDAWPVILSKERQGYAELKKKYIFDPNEVADGASDWSLNNPLSLSEESPWTVYFKDIELQKIIRQDVERTFPDQPMFREKEIQDIMVAVLFIWCKLNPDVSYRQGMHELLAPILLVVEQDRLPPLPADSTSGDVKLDPVIAAVFDADFFEHDAAVLFYRLMKAAKPWFEVGSESDPPRTGRSIRKSNYDEHRNSGQHAVSKVPVIAFCSRVQNDLLRALDVALYTHLEKQGIEPQLYGIRWLRLLFGREFPIPQLLTVWDGLFADDANLSLVEFLCVAMLLYLRKDLLGEDYAMTLHRLMKFPPPEQLETDAAQFILSARGLRERYNQNALLMSSKSDNSDLGMRSNDRTVIPPHPVRKRTTQPWVGYSNSTSKAQNTTSGGTSAREGSDGLNHNTEIPPVASSRHQIKALAASDRDRVLAKRLDECAQVLSQALSLKRSTGNTSESEWMERVLKEVQEVAQELCPEMHTSPHLALPARKSSIVDESDNRIGDRPDVPITPAVTASTSRPPLLSHDSRTQTASPRGSSVTISKVSSSAPLRQGSSADIRNAVASDQHTAMHIVARGPPTAIEGADTNWPADTAELVVEKVKAGVSGLNKVISGLFDEPRSDATNGWLSSTGGHKWGSSADIRAREMHTVQYPPAPRTSRQERDTASTRDPLGAGARTATTTAYAATIVPRATGNTNYDPLHQVG
ncbi:TBC1 domain, member 5 [Gaertneriomyces sp. JEL0708]|nr:TBC1 domain, member 5 [Gaertneriomyces sp. JEL0708]